MITVYLDQKIRESFAIYQGNRSYEEDTKLYMFIYGALHDEILHFVEENLGEEKLKHLEETKVKIIQESNNEQERFARLYAYIIKELFSIPYYQYRLYARLDHFINNLFWDTVTRYANNIPAISESKSRRVSPKN